LPKSLLTVGNKTLLDYTVKPLIDAGVGRLVLATGLHEDLIKQHVDDHYPQESHETRIDYTVVQPPTSLRSVIAQALKATTNEATGPIVLCDGDAIRIGLDLQGLYSFQTKGDYGASFATTSKRVDGLHWRITNDEAGEAINVQYGPPMPNTTTFIGCMMLNGAGVATLADALSPQAVLALLQSHNTTANYCTPVDYFNVNTPADAMQALQFVGTGLADH
jgi:NDP-sugar pyrophosphorylase family protein